MMSPKLTGKRENSRSSVPLYILFFVTFLNLAADNAFGETRAWVRQNSGTLAWLYGVFFVNESKGWAVGSKGTLLATTDGGKTWQSRRRPSEDIVRDIYFTDESNGWLLCERNVYELKKDDARTYLMQTTDGGEHWERVDLDPDSDDEDFRLVRAVFSRNGCGWVFGEAGTIFASRDSGASWVRLRTPTRHLLLGGTFIDDDRGWIVGAGGTILRTSDGGETWHLARLTDATGVRFSSASFVDNRLGWAAGNSGAMYRTVNGGRSWQRLNSGVTADLYDVKFLNSSEGWAAGANGTVISTNDGGLHWEVDSTGTEHPIERLFFADRSHGWAVGFGGTLLAYVRVEGPTLRK
jgi:photosystem II stability/assembly factor-like uncharacterized protein